MKVFLIVVPGAIIASVGVRIHRYAAAVREERRYPPSGHEDSYGFVVTNEELVEEHVKERESAARGFFAIAAGWVIGMGVLSFYVMP